MSLLAELKRRNVIRVAGAYLALGWIVTQITSTIAPVMHMPEWVSQVVVWVGVIAFPFVLLFSWAYELTPEGLKRESEVDRSASVTHITARRLDLITIVLVVAAVALYLLDPMGSRQRVAPPPSAAEASTAAAGENAAPAAGGAPQPAAPDVKERSIAVLPFVNMSSDKEQEYFSDGISEELLNQLARIPELQVTSRGSAFAFKGEKIAYPEIAKRLNVAHILEGSVRKSGNKIRITAQLIDARTDTHLWSQTWDRTLDDIFAVQDEIAGAVVEQLKIKLLGVGPKANETDPKAYALYLQAQQLSRQYTAAGYEQAIALFGQVLAIDPDYVPALIRLSLTYSNQTLDGLRPALEGSRLAREAADKALAIEPESAPAHAALAVLAMLYDRDLAAAARHAEKALALEPGNTSVLITAANLAQALGRPQQSIAINQAIIARDPVNAVVHSNLGNSYLGAGRPDEAIASYRTALALSPGLGGAQASIAHAFLYKAQPAEALAAVQQESSEIYRLPELAVVWHALGKSAESDAALAEAIQKHAQESAVSIAAALAFRGEIDRAFEWLDKAVVNHDPNLVGLAFAATDPTLAALLEDPRWLPLLRKLGKAPEQLAAIPFDVKLTQ